MKHLVFGFVLIFVLGFGYLRTFVDPMATVITHDSVRGVATVTDGDTLKFVGAGKTVRVRMQGIDAPESKQTCMRAGVVYACGEHSTQALVDYIGADPVVCQSQGYDRYKRMIGLCAVERHGTLYDLGDYMVGNGHAIAYRRYSNRYAKHEDIARAEKLGLWSGAFVNPSEWRRGRRLNP